MSLRLALLIGLIASAISDSASAADPARPRLLVLVYFDQFRGDYLARWSDQLGKDGFQRLMRDGAWFQKCHYPYAYTVTAAGHASVATGCWPALHGVVGNDWFERSVGKSVNCVGSDPHQQVPVRTAEGDDSDEKKGAKGGVSPERLRKPTIADALKRATGGKGRVVSLSLKNRGAALPGGQTPDAAYWMDSGTGQFVTSDYYRPDLHKWVAEFNAENPADKWRGTTWERLRSELDYTKLSGPDDSPGESNGASGQGRVFPHPFEPTDPKAKPAYFSALYASPFGNELLLDLAVRAIGAEDLGQDDVTDLLAISFSSNDAVGHAWGPDSHEVLDVTLRSDLVMQRLLKTLDEKVGAGRYVLAMSADHGVCPTPESSRRQGQAAERVQPAPSAKVEEFLTGKYGKASKKWLQAVSGPWIYLNPKSLAEANLKQPEVEAALAAWIKEQPGVRNVYTRTGLTAQPADLDPIGEMVSKSFDPERCGDLYVLLQPYCLASAFNGTGTTHGSPWPYDTHVPLLVYGTGVKAGVHEERVTPLAAAPILARAAGIDAPEGCVVPVPEGLFADQTP